MDENEEMTEVITNNEPYQIVYSMNETAETTEVVTNNGTLQIVHQITIGDMVISLLLVILIIFGVLKFFFNKLWR